MANKSKSSAILVLNCVDTTNHLKHYSLSTQPLKRYHPIYACYVISIYLLAGQMSSHLETTHYLRSTYMPTAEPTTCLTTSESSTKTQNICYNDPNNPTQDELYRVALTYPHYINLRYYGYAFISMCNHGDCNICPFTTSSSNRCFLDVIDASTYSRLQQSHPELFL